MHYLDNAATTAVAPEVITAVTRTMEEHFGNPSSLYAIGAYSEQAIEKARAQLAKALGCQAAQVYFTACGSESNNIALQGAAAARKKWGRHMVCTGFEHPSVAKQMERFAQEGYEVTFIMPDKAGHIDCDAMVEAVRADTCLVTFMWVNNEIGTLLPAPELARRIKEKNPRTAVHVDGVQAFGKIAPCLAQTDIDSYSLSGHKIHAPKGVGALYLRRGYHIEPPFLGGGQEKGIRPGTENIPYIVGLAKATEAFCGKEKALYAKAEQLAQRLRAGLAQRSGITFNSPEDAVPHVVNFSVDGVRSETLLHFLEAREVYVSSGSACSKGAASHTLVAMDLPAARIDGAVRVSFSDNSTAEDVDALLAGLAAAETELAKIR